MLSKLRQFGVEGLGYISLGLRVPNFPNRAGPYGLGSFGKLGNWEICICSHFPISQFHKSCWAIWAGVIWENGKLENMCQ